VKEQSLAKQVQALSAQVAVWQQQAQAPQPPGWHQARWEAMAAGLAALQVPQLQLLHESERNLRWAEQLAHVGYFARDLLTGRSQWSEETFRILGLPSQSEPVDSNFFRRFIHPEDCDRIIQTITEAVQAAKPFNAEFRIVRPDGGVRTLNYCGEVSCNESGQPVRFFGAVLDITDRREAEQELRNSREQLRALTGRLEAVREEERTRLAREIHDVLAQELTRLKLDLAWLNRRLSQPPGSIDPAPLQHKLEAMLAATDTAVTTVQRIATELRPVVLDTLGLCAAIEWQAQDFATHSGIRCVAQLPLAAITLPCQLSTVLFRILQESLTNVARHAQATQVMIHLEPAPDSVSLTIHDNGRGFEGGQPTEPQSLGLLGMRERAALLGGRCHITSGPGQGTTVEAWLPLSSTASVKDSSV
jgi:PAS domain S-box-containing protein